MNINKTEVILFRPKRKTISKNMILTDQHLSWNQHLKMLKRKLSRANGLLAIPIINFKNKYTLVQPPSIKETKIMILNEIIKLENGLLALHHINQCLPLKLKNLLTNENDLHNYST